MMQGLQYDPQGLVVPGLLRDAPGILKLIGQEQELTQQELPDIKLAEFPRPMTHLLLTDHRPPRDTEEDGRLDTGVMWTRRVNVRDLGLDKIHLAHIGSQLIKVQWEGEFSHGASTL